MAASCSDLVSAIGRDLQIPAVSCATVSGSPFAADARVAGDAPLSLPLPSDTNLLHVAQYFGNVVASSSRTPPAQRVQAALVGGLFRSPAAALSPGQVWPLRGPQTPCRASRLVRHGSVIKSPCSGLHALLHGVDGNAAARKDHKNASCIHAGHMRCGIVTVTIAGDVCRRWA